MSFPAFIIPTPSIADPLQYPAGAQVGVDTAADKWEVAGGAMQSVICPYVTHDPTDPNYNTYTEIEGGFTYAAYKTPAGFGADQWVACQCIVPLDNATGVFPGVRVNPSTGDGYFVVDVGSTDGSGMWVGVMRRNGGVETSIPLSMLWPANSNQITVDGVTQSDGFMAMLEVRGSNPVELRLTVLLSRDYLRATPGTRLGSETAALTVMPGEIGFGNTMPHAYTVVGTYQDASASRITSGRPGLLGIGINSAGGVYGFNAGQLLSISAGTVTGGACTVTVCRSAGTTVSLSADHGSVGSTSWAGDIGTATVTELPAGTTTIAATASDGETASVIVTFDDVPLSPAIGPGSTGAIGLDVSQGLPLRDSATGKWCPIRYRQNGKTAFLRRST